MNDYLRKDILDIMDRHRGREHAISRRDLRARLRDIFPAISPRRIDRDMRDAIHQDGTICSGQEGYYYPDGPSEAREAVRFLDSYIISLAERRRALLKAYPKAGEGVQQEFPKELGGVGAN